MSHATHVCPLLYTADQLIGLSKHAMCVDVYVRSSLDVTADAGLAEPRRLDAYRPICGPWAMKRSSSWATGHHVLVLKNTRGHVSSRFLFRAVRNQSAVP